MLAFMSKDKKNLGKLGEDLAVDYLEKHGHQILARNFHCRQGEIDIIACEGDCLVFIEVKTRFSDSYGVPEEAVTPGKIRSIVMTGQYYQLLHPGAPEGMRIDVVAVEFEAGGKLRRLEQIKNVTS